MTCVTAFFKHKLEAVLFYLQPTTINQGRLSVSRETRFKQEKFSFAWIKIFNGMTWVFFFISCFFFIISTGSLINCTLFQFDDCTNWIVDSWIDVGFRTCPGGGEWAFVYFIFCVCIKRTGQLYRWVSVKNVSNITQVKAGWLFYLTFKINCFTKLV